MAKKWRAILEKLEAEHEKRRIQAIGKEAVTCNLPCHGNHIPREYGHTREYINVFCRGISVKGWENPPEGDATYYGTTCDLTDGKVCVATDETLRKAVER